MNDFVNYGKRGIQLPQGCKDLIDVLQQTRAASAIDISAAQSSCSAVFKTESITTRGLDHVAHYIVRLLQPSKKSGALLIAAHHPLFSIGLFYQTESLVVALPLISRNINREPAIRMLFSQAGIEPFDDSVIESGGSRINMLRYPLPADAPAAARLIVDLLQRAYGVSDEAGLDFLDCENDSDIQ